MNPLIVGPAIASLRVAHDRCVRRTTNKSDVGHLTNLLLPSHGLNTNPSGRIRMCEGPDIDPESTGIQKSRL